MHSGSDGSATRILLVHPHALVRQGIIRVLETLETMEVAGHTGTSAEAVRLAGELEPDVVIIDADVAEDPSELVERISRLPDGGRILLLSDRVSAAHVQRLLAAGAAGYTVKDIGIVEFADVLARVADGEIALHSKAAAALATGYGPGQHRSPALTDRQTEVLRLLAEGLGNKQIARRLGIGTHTVKTHVSRILEKLEVSSRTEAVVVAMQDRLIG